MGSEVVLVDPAREIAAQARVDLAQHNKLATRVQGRVRLCFSADLPRAERFTKCAIDFSREMGSVASFELINLQDYCFTKV